MGYQLVRPLDRGPGGRLCTAVLALLLLVTGSVLVQLPAAPVQAGPDGTTAPGRIAYGGTQHRSIGTVDPGDTGRSDPFFPGGPQHHDDEVSARGDTVVWTSLRDSARPQVYLRRGDGPVVRLTDSAEGVRHPVPSPDGSRVAYAATTDRPDGGHDIWVVNADGSDPRRVTDGRGDNVWPTWSPDGELLAFSGKRGTGGDWQIHRVPAAGGTVEQLTDDAVDEEAARTEELGNLRPSWDPVAAHDRILVTCRCPDGEGGEDGEPARLKVIPASGSLGSTGVEILPGQDSRQGSWSPDGTSVAFVSRSLPGGPTGAGTPDRVYTVGVGADGTVGTPLLRLAEDRLVAGPTWYPPGGERLLVSRTTAATAATMDLMDVLPDGSDPRDLQVPLRDLNQDRAYGYGPSDVSQQYSPDGRMIAFTRVDYENDTRRSRVWLAGADGSDPRPLPDEATPETASTGFPAWSPDGTRIAVTRSCIPCRIDTEIAVLEVATGRQLYVVPSTEEQSETEPAWSPDGATLAFARQTPTGEGQEDLSHLWTAAAADGGGQRNLTAVDDPLGGRTREGHPAYSPDGSTLAYSPAGQLGLVGADGTGPRILPDPQGVCWVSESYGNGCGDPAWSPDGGRLAASGKEQAAATPHDPETVRRYIALVDPATGEARRITGARFRGAAGEDGQQVAPTWQPTSDLGTELAVPPEPVTEGEDGSLVVTVVNRGPAPSPGTTLTIDVPEQLRPAGAVPDTGSCAEGLHCDLGILPSGRVVRVELTFPGNTPGTFPVTWTVGGTLPDPDESDNRGDAQVVVTEPAPPSSPPPSPSPSPSPSVPPSPSTPPGPEPTPGSPSPPPQSTPPAPPTLLPPGPPTLAPSADPAVRLTVTPDPAYVGGLVTATYRVSNGGARPAAGVRVRLTLPSGVPVSRRPAQCDARLRCRVGDLAPGASEVLRVVLAPRSAGTLRLAARLTSTGPDATAGNNRAVDTARVLRPRIEVVPEIGPPGFVTSVRGRDFPPGVPVRLTWEPGVTPAARPAVPGADGTFTAQLLVLPNDTRGARTVTASDARPAGPAAPAPATAEFLVVDRTPDPPLFDSRNF